MQVSQCCPCSGSEIRCMPNINYNRPLGSCQRGERLFPLRRFDCSPFKPRKFETANRAYEYENANHKAVVSTQRLPTIKTVPTGNGVAIKQGGAP